MENRSNRSIKSKTSKVQSRVASARQGSKSSLGYQIATLPKGPSGKQAIKKPPTPADTSNLLERNQTKEEGFSAQSLAKFMNDFNRMKIKMNVLLTTQKEQEEKIGTLQDMVDKLTAENIKVNADMRILRDEHTEVLH